jgi:hypothetical protein
MISLVFFIKVFQKGSKNSKVKIWIQNIFWLCLASSILFPSAPSKINSLGWPPLRIHKFVFDFEQ